MKAINTSDPFGSRKGGTFVGKKGVLFLAALLCGGLCAFPLCACSFGRLQVHTNSMTNELAFSRETYTESDPESRAETGLYGSYRSADGAVLTLSEDGTFSFVSVTVMAEIKNASGERLQIVEAMDGTYSVEGSVCSLQIANVSVHADGINDFDMEQIEQGAGLLAGNDPDARALYARLLSGDTLSGQELYGEDAFNEILQNDLRVTLNEADRMYDMQTEKT